MKAKAKDVQTAIKSVLRLTGGALVTVHESGHVSAEVEGRYLKLRIDGVSDTGKKKLTVDSETLLGTIGATGDCTIKVNETQLMVKTAKSDASLNSEEFTSSLEFNMSTEATLSPKVQRSIKNLLGLVGISDIHATQTVDTAHVMISGKRIVVGQFDHYHFALAQSTVKSSTDFDAKIPSFVFNQVSALSGESELNFHIDDAVVRMQSEALEFQSPLFQSDKELSLEMTTGVVKNLKAQCSVEVDPKEFLEALAKTASLFDARSGAKLVVGSGKIEIKSGTEYGKISASIDAKATKKFETFIHPGLTADVVRVAAANQKKLTINFDKNIGWIAITNDNITCHYGFLYVN